MKESEILLKKRVPLGDYWILDKRKQETISWRSWETQLCLLTLKLGNWRTQERIVWEERPEWHCVVLELNAMGKTVSV